jgi:GTP-binding protein EngB required for normal cell division
VSDADLDRRLAALAAAAALARGRLEDGAVDAAEAVVARAGERLGLGVGTTVVALAGPTGAGKSSLFNALAGDELVRAGHLRPTTSATTAAIWGDVGDPLLDWLGVQRRHRLPAPPDGLVLLDLPDFDSVERANREEVERVVALADLMAWIVDPQKYADGVLHEGYLRPFAEHGETMLVVLNQADRLDAAAEAACVADLGRLLAADGLPGLPVLAVSARTGEGLEALRAELDRRAAARQAATARLAADVAGAAAALAQEGGGRPGKIGRGDRAALTAALAGAAGVPAVVRAVAGAHRRSGALATGWPFLRWVRRLGPDPLRRLRLGTGAETPALGAGGDGAPAARSSLPAATPVQRAQVETAARALADRAAGDLPAPWPALARRAALAQDAELPARLDAAVAGTDLKLRTPRWWRLAGALQLLLALATLAGGLWLLALAGLGYLRLDDVVPTPEIAGVPAPTLLLGGGALLGLLLALLAGLAVRAGARRRGRVAERALLARVETVGQEAVVAPVEAELEARQRLADALASAGTGRDRGRVLIAS